MQYLVFEIQGMIQIAVLEDEQEEKLENIKYTAAFFLADVRFS